MIGSRTTRIRRARLVPIALTTAALSSAVLGASVTGTLSAFNASITNNTNTAVSGSLVMKETAQDGSTNCLSSSGANNAYTTCSTINKYGGTAVPLTPGSPKSVYVNIANLGSTAATGFSIRPGTCVKTDVGPGAGTTSNNGDLCTKLQLTVTCQAQASDGTLGTSYDVYRDQALSAIANADVDLKAKSANCVPQNGGANSVRYTFTVQIPSTQDNTVQGQQVSQPLTWTFTGA